MGLIPVVTNNQSSPLACGLHTWGINMMCPSCLVTSDASPASASYRDPYVAYYPMSLSLLTQPHIACKSTETRGANGMFQADEVSYMRKMHAALKEMDDTCQFVPDGHFLDLGCCPGGFSTYVLGKWPDATGVGMSLPADGPSRHSLAVPMELRSRLEVHYADITMFNLAPSLIHALQGGTIFAPCPVPSRSFDFVIADGHQPPNITKGNPREPWNRDRLLLSQLLIALRAVRPKGILLVKLSLESSVPLMPRIVIALSRLTPIPIRATKPTCIYADAGTFYVLIYWPNADLCDELIRILEVLWYIMTFNGPNGFGRGLSERDMDLITAYADILATEQQLELFLAPIHEIRRTARLRMALRANT